MLLILMYLLAICVASLVKCLFKFLSILLLDYFLIVELRVMITLNSSPSVDMELPCGSYNKEAACNAGDPGSILGSGKSSGEGNGNPLQYSCLENPIDSGSGGLQSMGLQRAGHD